MFVEFETRPSSAIRPGSHVLDLANWMGGEATWTEIVSWLATVPPLDEIETFWVEDGGRRKLLISGMPRPGARWPDLSDDQWAWLRDLAGGPVVESRRGNRRSGAILNPLRGQTSGRVGPDLVDVELKGRTRTWSITDRGRAILTEGVGR